MEKYLVKIRPYLKKMTSDLTASGKCKIQLTMKINFLLSKDSGESQPMDSKSGNRIIMTGNNTNKIISDFLVHFSLYIKQV